MICGIVLIMLSCWFKLEALWWFSLANKLAFFELEWPLSGPKFKVWLEFCELELGELTKLCWLLVWWLPAFLSITNFRFLSEFFWKFLPNLDPCLLPPYIWEFCGLLLTLALNLESEVIFERLAGDLPGIFKLSCMILECSSKSLFCVFSNKRIQATE